MIGYQRYSSTKPMTRVSCGIYSEFLAQGARDPVNVDCRVAELVRTKVENNPSRWCFDEAEASD